MLKKFEEFLKAHDQSAWLACVSNILPEIHEIDRNATQIWFRFFPLELFRYLEKSEDRETTVHNFVMQGAFELKNQIDTSHRFLYGHRFWKETKSAIAAHSKEFDLEKAELTRQIREIAKNVATASRVNESLTVGITAIGLMTLLQTGSEAFFATEGNVDVSEKFSEKCAKDIVAARSKDDSQGIFGFLKTVDKRFTVHWSDAISDGIFKIKCDADIATASALDRTQNWKERDPRCWEGVVPVECRSASCGTCWVGILGGQEKLSEVAPLERKQMKVFGYNQPEEPRPFLRLACQAKATGNITLVIPPWNGVFGRKFYGNV
jgi:ferredoxin